MATEADIDRALQRIGEAVAGRSLNTKEVETLKKSFRSRTGTPYDRAIRAVGEALGIGETTTGQKFAASDNPDRLMQDLTQLVSPPKKP